MHRTISTILAAALTAASPAVGEEGAPWRTRLVELVQAAAAQNPYLRAMGLQVEAARHRVPQAGALADPELELGLRDVPFDDLSLSRDDFTMETIALRQAWPAAGKRDLRRTTARAMLDEIEAQHRRHVLDVVAETADAFFTLAETDSRLILVEESRRRLDSAAVAATERFRVGQGSQSDVLRASLATTQLQEETLGLDAGRQAQAARLNALLGRAASEPVDALPTLGEGWDSELSVPQRDELERLAAERSPEVHAARALLAAAEAELALAALESRPDWMLAGYYGRRERFDDFIGVSAAVTLPWARRERLATRRAEKEAERAAAAAGIDAVEARLHGEIGIAYAEWEKNRAQLHLYRNVILPQAEVHFEAAREAYTVARVDFPTLISAALDLDGYRRETATRAAGVGRAVAALQRASGVALVPGTPGGESNHAKN